jgi:hypothetical protein
MQEKKRPLFRPALTSPGIGVLDLNPLSRARVGFHQGPPNPGAGLLKTAHSERRLDNAEPIGASSRSGSGNPSMENRGSPPKSPQAFGVHSKLPVR